MRDEKGMKLGWGERIFRVLNPLYLTLLSLAMFIPFWLVITTAFSSEASIRKYGYAFWPKEFSLDAMNFVIEGGSVAHAYLVSFTVTIVGTFIAVLITAMAGYALANKQLKYRNGIALVFYFTMLFSGGIVPWYIMINSMGLRNSIWVMILPMCFSPWNMLLIRNFFQTLPSELRESAQIDGAKEMKIFIRVVLPMSLPGLATITLFYMLGYWNDWWLAMNFIDNEDLYPLQYLLRQVLSTALYASRNSAMQSSTTTGSIPTETVKAATSIATIGPIVLVYPFIQRYFIKGLTVGAVKG